MNRQALLFATGAFGIAVTLRTRSAEVVVVVEARACTGTTGGDNLVLSWPAAGAIPNRVHTLAYARVEAWTARGCAAPSSMVEGAVADHAVKWP